MFALVVFGAFAIWWTSPIPEPVIEPVSVGRVGINTSAPSFDPITLGRVGINTSTPSVRFDVQRPLCDMNAEGNMIAFQVIRSAPTVCACIRVDEHSYRWRNAGDLLAECPL